MFNRIIMFPHNNAGFREPGKNSSESFHSKVSSVRVLFDDGAKEDIISAQGSRFIGPECARGTSHTFTSPHLFNDHTPQLNHKVFCKMATPEDEVLNETNKTLTNVTGREAATREGLITAYTFLFSMALIPIFIGSIRSVTYHYNLWVGFYDLK